MKAKSRITLIGAVALAGGAVAWGPLAHAEAIGIGLSTAPGTASISTVDVGTGSASFSGSFGTFSLNLITGIDTAASGFPTLLNSTTNNVSTSTAGTLYVWVSAIGLISPSSASTMAIGSSFTSNELPAGWTVSEATYYDPSDSAFGTTDLVGSTTFSSIGVDTTGYTSVPYSGYFSMTELYTITSTGSGTTLDTISAYVPEPGSLGILGLGLSAIGALGWSRRRRNQKSVK